MHSWVIGDGLQTVADDLETKGWRSNPSLDLEQDNKGRVMGIKHVSRNRFWAKKVGFNDRVTMSSGATELLMSRQCEMVWKLL